MRLPVSLSLICRRSNSCLSTCRGVAPVVVVQSHISCVDPLTHARAQPKPPASAAAAGPEHPAAADPARAQPQAPSLLLVGCVPDRDDKRTSPTVAEQKNAPPTGELWR